MIKYLLPVVGPNMIYTKVDKYTKREVLIYTFLSVFFFVTGAFALWGNLFDFCQMLGSIICGTPIEALKIFVRVFPTHMIAISLAFYGFRVIGIYRTEPQDRPRKWKHTAVTSICLGAVISLSVVVLLIAGVYEKLVEGYPSPLFPLDVLVCGLLFVAFGCFLLQAVPKMEKHLSKIQGYHPHRSVIKRIGYFYAYLISAFSFAGFFYGIFYMDWSHGMTFYNVMLLINFAVPVIEFILYRFYYTEVLNEKKQLYIKNTVGYIFLFNFVVFFLYLIAVNIFPDAPCQNASAVLPIEFSSNVNAFLILYAIANLVFPLVAFIKYQVLSRLTPEALKKDDEEE